MSQASTNNKIVKLDFRIFGQQDGSIKIINSDNTVINVTKESVESILSLLEEILEEGETEEKEQCDDDEFIKYGK